jgi:hypothetical protein
MFGLGEDVKYIMAIEWLVVRLIKRQHSLLLHGFADPSEDFESALRKIPVRRWFHVLS